MKTIKVQTKKIYSHDEFGKPNVETNTISLNEGKAFDGFIRFLNSQRYMEMPSVKQVVNGDEKDIEVFQNAISNVYGKKPSELKVNYKQKSEAQEQEIARLKAQNESFEARFKALENEREEVPEEMKLLRAKHVELFGKEAHPKMGIEKLKLKIQDKENN